MRKLIIITVILFAAISSVQVMAQKATIQEISAYAGGGLSALRYKLSLGDRSGGGGVDFGFGYTYAWPRERVTGSETVFSERIGVYTGIGFGFYNASAKVAGVHEPSALEKDSDGDEFYLITTLSGYKEKQNSVFLNIPVMADYQVEPFYFRAGFKFGIPLNGKYRAKDATLKNVSEYPKYESKISDIEWLSCGEFKKTTNGKVDLGVAVMLALEAGYKYRIRSNIVLYGGAYLDIGMNNVAKKSGSPLVNYAKANPSEFTTNSVMSSFADKTKIMAVGVKVHVAWMPF